jgi:hypothetical protein
MGSAPADFNLMEEKITVTWAWNYGEKPIPYAQAKVQLGVKVEAGHRWPDRKHL